MRTIDPTLLASLATRGGVDVHQALWIEARNRTTGAAAPMGLWTGDQDVTLTVEGTPRDFAGGGAMPRLRRIVHEAGVAVRRLRVEVNPLHPAVAEVLRGREPALARVRLYQAFFVPGTMDLIAPPQRIWKGFVETAPIVTAEEGGESLAEITLASAAMALTRPLALTRSDAVQGLRSADRFLRHAAVSGSVTIYWGAKRA